MGKRNIDKQVYEQYLDATVALFMEHYTAALTDAVLAEESAPATGSESMDHRCLEMIRKECAKLRRKEAWKGTKKVLRSAAVIVVALLSLSSILFMTVEAFRVPVINFFIEQGDGFWAITGRNSDDPIDPTTSDSFDPDDPLAGLLPEGYRLDKVSGDLDNGLLAVYISQNGEKIRFAITRSPDITVDSENAPISKRHQIAGLAGVYVHKDGASQLAWVDKEKRLSYLLSADTASESELLSIAEQFMEQIVK